MRAVLARLSGRDALAAALVLVGALGMFAGALAASPWLLALSLAACLVGDPLLYRSYERPVARWFSERRIGAAQRALIRETVVVAGWIHMAEPAPGSIALAIMALLAVHTGHVLFRIISQRTRRLGKRRIPWVNLDVKGEARGPRTLPPALPSLGPLSGPRIALYADVPVTAGLAIAAFTRNAPVTVTGALVSIVLAALVTLRAAHQYVVARRLPPPARGNHLLLKALRTYAPEVVVYFSGPPTTTYQLNVWLETIDRIRRPTLIIIRERQHLEELLPTTTPIVVLPRAQDVEDFRLASMRVALYPTTVIRNNHMIRLPGIRHVFINHGDGDKSVTYSPLHRVFDEIWVAGQAGVDRYLTRGEGVRPDQLVKVGRPQLGYIRRATEAVPGRPVTVLYAPTWEGNFDGVDYSSVAPMGVQIVTALLTSGRPFRLLFKPHPATGSRLWAAGRARTKIERLIASAGAPHAVVAPTPQSLYDAFNEADVLITDVSSVVADFLASRKPYIVTNPQGLPAGEFGANLPSTTGGGILAPDSANLFELLDDACGPDSMRSRREALATYFLGEPVADPVQRFVDEVDRACTDVQPVIVEGRRS